MKVSDLVVGNRYKNISGSILICMYISQSSVIFERADNRREVSLTYFGVENSISPLDPTWYLFKLTHIDGEKEYVSVSENKLKEAMNVYLQKKGECSIVDFECRPIAW